MSDIINNGSGHEVREEINTEFETVLNNETAETTRAEAAEAAIQAQITESTLEARHIVGTEGEPAFITGHNTSDCVPVAFYKDPFGIIHLEGVADGCNGTPIFQLPEGYRPTQTLAHVFPSSPVVYFTNDGNIYSGAGSRVYFDGITFRP